MSSEPNKSYSCFDEQAIIRRLLDALPSPPCSYCVDIGAGDGRYASNSLALFEQGWKGLAVEGDETRFEKMLRNHAKLPGVEHRREMITPDNVLGLLDAHRVPADFGFLTLDIDSWDNEVLDRILARYRPALVCTEINEKLPPPLNFSVRHHPEHRWAGDHFYGQSICAVAELAAKHRYAMVELEYCNVFLVPRELSRIASRGAAELYAHGYLNRPDRLKKFPWNENMEPLHALGDAGKETFVRSVFAHYAGRFECSIDRRWIREAA